LYDLLHDKTVFLFLDYHYRAQIIQDQLTCKITNHSKSSGPV